MSGDTPHLGQVPLHPLSSNCIILNQLFFYIGQCSKTLESWGGGRGSGQGWVGTGPEFFCPFLGPSTKGQSLKEEAAEEIPPVSSFFFCISHGPPPLKPLQFVSLPIQSPVPSRALRISPSPAFTEPSGFPRGPARKRSVGRGCVWGCVLCLLLGGRVSAVGGSFLWAVPGFSRLKPSTLLHLEDLISL